MNRFLKFGLRLACGLVCLALVAAACSSGDDEDMTGIETEVSEVVQTLLDEVVSTATAETDASSAGASSSAPGPSATQSSTPNTMPEDTASAAASATSTTTTSTVAPPTTTSTTTTTTTTSTTTTTTTTQPPTVFLDGPGELRIPSPLPDGEPGELIQIENLGEFQGDFSAHRILYHSRDREGENIAVSGYALVPSDQPPEGGWPVIAYAHGTTGLADECAPSEGVEDTLSSFGISETLLTTTAVSLGYAVVATDYEGLGTPGLHPYLVGQSEAQSILDSVRALNNWAGDRVSDSFAVLGFSQGGHAAMHAGQYWQSYAPELDLVGVVAGAAPSQFESIESSYEDELGRTFLMMIFGAFADSYDEISASDVLTPEGVRLLDELENGCFSYLRNTFGELDIASLQTVENPLNVPGLREIARENDLNQRPHPAPLLMLHGTDDQVVDYERSEQLCPQIIDLPSQGPTHFISFVDEDHYSLALASARDMIDWLSDRFAGEEMTEVGCDTRKDTVVAEVFDFFRGVRGAYDAVRDFFGNLGRSIGDFFSGLFG